ncbi:MAG: hypothetical protein ABH859_08570 [Pseudomonadota bacterium]
MFSGSEGSIVVTRGPSMAPVARPTIEIPDALAEFLRSHDIHRAIPRGMVLSKRGQGNVYAIEYNENSAGHLTYDITRVPPEGNIRFGLWEYPRQIIFVEASVGSEFSEIARPGINSIFNLVPEPRQLKASPRSTALLRDLTGETRNFFKANRVMDLLDWRWHPAGPDGINPETRGFVNFARFLAENIEQNGLRDNTPRLMAVVPSFEVANEPTQYPVRIIVDEARIADLANRHPEVMGRAHFITGPELMRSYAIRLLFSEHNPLLTTADTPSLIENLNRGGNFRQALPGVATDCLPPHAVELLRIHNDVQRMGSMRIRYVRPEVFRMEGFATSFRGVDFFTPLAFFAADMGSENLRGRPLSNEERMGAILGMLGSGLGALLAEGVSLGSALQLLGGGAFGGVATFASVRHIRQESGLSWDQAPDSPQDLLFDGLTSTFLIAGAREYLIGAGLISTEASLTEGLVIAGGWVGAALVAIVGGIYLAKIGQEEIRTNPEARNFAQMQLLNTDYAPPSGAGLQMVMDAFE